MKSYAFQKIKSFMSSMCLFKALKPSGEPVLFKENLYYSFGKCHPASVNAYVFNFYTSKIKCESHKRIIFPKIDQKCLRDF